MDGQGAAEAEEGKTSQKSPTANFRLAKVLSEKRGRNLRCGGKNQVLPNRHTARSGWTPNDFAVLRLIRDAYEWSTGVLEMPLR